MQEILLFLTLLWAPQTLGFCPENCYCDNIRLAANCSFSEEKRSEVEPLEVIPIMLNPSLKRLSASNNEFRKLEGALRVYKDLEFLDLSLNEFKTLGRRQFVELSRLQYLDLSNNFLTSLHKESFKGLKSLITMDLNDNALSTMDESSFVETDSLVELRLKGNKLISLTKDTFYGLRRLRVLHLENNLLSDLHRDWFLPLENLRFLYLEGNLLSSLPSEGLPLSALRVLTLKKNKLHDLEGGNPFKGLRSVDTLDLSYNLFEKIPYESLRDATNVRRLDLSGNPIQRFDIDSFKSLFLLEILRLNNMPYLESIEPLTFMDNIKLTELHLNSNLKLKGIPTGLFASNTRMKVFSLRNGSLTTLSPRQLPPSSLEALLLGGLPLYCNCSLTWLWELYQRNKNSSNLQLDPVICANLGGRPKLEEVSVDSLACTDFTRILVAVSVAIIVTVSFLLLGIGIACAYRIRKQSRSPHTCLYIKDDTMIYKYGQTSSDPQPLNHSEEEPFYEVPKYSSTQDDDPKSSGSSSKYSSSGYVGSELWESEYYATVKSGIKSSLGYGSPLNSNSSTGSSGGANINNNNTNPRTTGSLSSPVYFSPSRGHLIHHSGTPIHRSSSPKNHNRSNMYV